MIIPHVVATYDEQIGGSLLFLRDLSATHHSPVERRLTADQTTSLDDIPAEATLHQIVETLAAFHAAWWEHPHLGTLLWNSMLTVWMKSIFVTIASGSIRIGSPVLPQRAIGCPRMLSPISARSSVCCRGPGNAISPNVSPRHQLTFLHTDAYLVNFLVPRTDEDERVYMLDWQAPWGGMGAFDLVMMCASFWTSAQRQENQREETMLRQYFAALPVHGVTNYTRDQLMEDYRLMILIFLQVAIWDQANGSVRDYWWPKLQCLLSAARDLDCVSLLR